MDFLDPKKKRAHNIRLMIGYCLMSVVLLIISIYFTLSAFGFGVDTKTGQIIQNGLVFIDSKPVSATVYINGKEKDQTDSRLLLPTGRQEVRLQRQGYRPWNYAFDLEAQSVERLVYPVLFPEVLSSSNVASFASNPAFVSQSPDRKWLAVTRPGTANVFDFYDLSSKQTTARSIRLPSSVLSSGKGHSYQLVDWAKDNKRLVLRHSFGKKSEYILIHRENEAAAVNLTKHFNGVTLTTLTLRDKDVADFYLHDTKTRVLSSISFATKRQTTVLNNVQQFKSHGKSDILFVTPGAEKNKVSLAYFDGKTTRTIWSLAAAQSHLLDIARFDNEWFMVAGNDKEDKAYIFRDPFGSGSTSGKVVPSIAITQDNPQFLSFSPNARFITLQNGKNISMYDAETQRKYMYKTPIDADSKTKFSWMDGFRLMTIHNKQLVVWDFDGTNAQILVNTPTLPFFSNNYETLFSISSDKKPQLAKTPLVVN